MSQEFAVSRVDGSDVIDHEEQQEYPASALVRTGHNGPSSVTIPVPQISVNQPSNPAIYSSNSVNQPNNLVHQPSNLLTPQTHVQDSRIATEPRDATTNMFAGLEVPVEEPGFHDNAGGADSTNSDEDQDLDESARAMNEEQKLSMLEAIAAADNPQTFMRDFKSAIPNGFEMTLWGLRLMMAPDKWVRNQEKQQSAVLATQNLEYAMDVLERQTGEIQRKDWKYYHEDPQVTEEKREPTGLRGYHLSSHMKATKHLAFLYDSMLKGNWANDPSTKQHRGALDKINRDLERQNKVYNYKSNIGCVDYFRLLGKWKFLHSSREMNDAVLKIAETTTVAFCRELQYPDGWSCCPPQDSYHYEPVQGYQYLLWSSLTPRFHFWYQKSLAGSWEIEPHVRTAISSFSQELDKINLAYNQDRMAHYVDISDIASRYSKLADYYRKGDATNFQSEHASLKELCRMRNYPDNWVPTQDVLPQMGSSQVPMGQPPMGSSQPTMGTSQVPMGQPPMGSSQPTMGTSQVPMGQPPMGSSQPTMGTSQVPMGQPPMGSSQPTMGTSQVPMGQPPMGSSQPTMGTSQVPMGQSPMGSSQPTMGTSQVPMGQPPMGSSQPTMGTSQVSMGQPPMHGSQLPMNESQTSSMSPQAVQASNQMQRRRMVIAIKPRTIKRSIEPGKTSMGEKIKFIQHLGTNRANFVVESTDGSVRLVPSASAGGKSAIEGAVSQGVPYITRSEAEINDLKRRVRAGGTYGLTWVAVGEWNTSQNRLPFVVVGFYHIFSNLRIDVAISRSNLAKILSLTESERMTAEVITGFSDMTIRDALESRLRGISPLYYQPRANSLHQPLGNQPQSSPWGPQSALAATGHDVNAFAPEQRFMQPKASPWDGSWGPVNPGGGQWYNVLQPSHLQPPMMPQWNYPQKQQPAFQHSYFQQPSAFQPHPYWLQNPMFQGPDQPAMTKTQPMPNPSALTDDSEDEL